MTKDQQQCSFTWNPGAWPYLTRCTNVPHPTGKHVDRLGRVHEQVSHSIEPLCGEVEALIAILTEPSYRSPSLHRDKCRTLAIEWPGLAAVLGALIQAAGREVPAPLRRAMKIVEESS
jgi:hypothetical protein